MRVQRLADLEGTDHEVHAPTFTSFRFVLADAEAGFSFHDTRLYAGTRTEMWYRHHVESVYCIEGRGLLTNVATGEIHEITPGTHYLVDQDDKHVLEAISDLRMMCVFSPALTGTEIHREDGSYAPADEAPGDARQARTDGDGSAAADEERASA